MRVFVRYFRPMVYGNYTTLLFDNIDADKTYVSLLKRKIQMKLRVEPRDQKLTVRSSTGITTLLNENNLAHYGLGDGATIIVENLSSQAPLHNHAKDKEFNCKAEQAHEHICKLLRG